MFGMDEHLCILYLLPKHDAHVSTLYVYAFMPNSYVDGSVGDESSIKDPDLIGV